LAARLTAIWDTVVEPQHLPALDREAFSPARTMPATALPDQVLNPARMNAGSER